MRPPLGRYIAADPLTYAIVVTESFNKCIMSSVLVAGGTKMVTLGTQFYLLLVE